MSKRKPVEIPTAWNPKRLGVQKSKNAPGLATDVWCYIVGRTLSIIVEVSRDGVVLGQTAYHDAARLPRLSTRGGGARA